MTEAEWLASEDPDELLGALRVPTLQTPLPERKSRLFGLACCERISHLITDPRSRSAIDVLARYAEGAATAAELGTAFEAAFDARHEIAERADNSSGALAHAANAIEEACHPDELAEYVAGAAAHAAGAAGMSAETSVHVDLARDIFGNPFRPVALEPAWLTSDVLALARGIYDERAFDRLPILADALQDAGCENEEVLSHCRGDGPHVRGCWVVDLLLGKV